MDETRTADPPDPLVPTVSGTAAERPSDDLLFAAVSATRMPMVVTDPHRPDNPIVFVNEAFVAMSGYAIDEVVGRNCRFLQGPDTDRTAVATLREAIERRVEMSTEILNYRKDGTTFWNALFVSPVRDRTGTLVYFVASQLDVSRRRDAEEALGQAQKMEAVGQLTGGISHDFNNLLQVMLGHVDLLDRRLRHAPLDARSIATASANIRSAIDKASTLTQQLLAFARRQRLEGRLTDLNELTGSLMALATRTLGGEVGVVMQLASDLGKCRVDRTQFEVALLNILINARDAMEGRGTVTIRTSNVEIEREDLRSFGGLEAGRYASIAVTDDGPGIPPEIVHRVMEPFFTTKEEGKGTGLGLSMVHGFAKQSGGCAQIYSEMGIGTTIRLYFPASGDEEERPYAATLRTRERGGSEVVLVVDDRAEVLNVATSLLDELGYRVLTAASGIEALALVESLDADARPALLFSDVIMPGGMNGYMLARRLRQRLPALKVLLTTGYAGDVHGAVSDDGTEFEVLKKPYKLDALARRVRLVLDTPARAA